MLQNYLIKLRQVSYELNNIFYNPLFIHLKIHIFYGSNQKNKDTLSRFFENLFKYSLQFPDNNQTIYINCRKLRGKLRGKLRFL